MAHSLHNLHSIQIIPYLGNTLFDRRSDDRPNSGFRQAVGKGYKNGDTLMIEGKEVVDIQIGKILAGTLFGTTNSRSDLQNHPTYFRNNSFGSWVRSGSALSARVEIGNYPVHP